MPLLPWNIVPVYTSLNVCKSILIEVMVLIGQYLHLNVYQNNTIIYYISLEDTVLAYLTFFDKRSGGDAFISEKKIAGTCCLKK